MEWRNEGDAKGDAAPAWRENNRRQWGHDVVVCPTGLPQRKEHWDLALSGASAFRGKAPAGWVLPLDCGPTVCPRYLNGVPRSRRPGLASQGDMCPP